MKALIFLFILGSTNAALAESHQILFTQNMFGSRLDVLTENIQPLLIYHAEAKCHSKVAKIENISLQFLGGSNIRESVVDGEKSIVTASEVRVQISATVVCN